ncbi:unnamed protein product [Rotaria sordida]|uniref:F-box domain-containing protein n=2 Tax=Rotaria sordida TaxID=392033 RepID=A0A819QYJ7_9BILA|nr:unnamed protein product [Rotaria sordida]CAF3663174.1 unnamed protein product [Rotaria sordida]CAF4037008.1 unnamed protein product [Rotaria sordida]
MKNPTLFEDLSNEVLCEIFDYLNAFDLFLTFASLNERISTILKYIRFHIIVDSMYCRYQIEFLSHHLTFHSHQVISLDICNKICDQINTIAYLFDRYEFPSLRFCTFRCLDASSKLKNVIKQLKKQTQLVSLHIFQSYDAKYDYLSRNHAHLFSEMVLLNIPLSLRCATLRFHYDYSQLITSTIINTNLTYLELLFYGTFDKISIYSLISVLRIYKSLRQLNVIIKSPNMIQHNTNFNISNALSINKNDLPIVASLKKFDLQILTQFDIHSLGLILHCMPNLHEISFTFITKDLNTPFIDVLLNGNIWQQILISHVQYLNKFNIHISLLTDEGLFDLKSILDSFRCFVTQFDGWHMAISRLETFEGPRTFYRYFYRNESREYIDNLSSLIDLSSIVTLEFRDRNHLRQSHIVPYILLACVNIKKLIMRTSLLVLPIVIDNPHLILTFSRIEYLRLFDDYLYFKSKPGTKIVQCFPCLTKIEIRVYWLDYCIPVIDTFLAGFGKLRFMIVEFVGNDLPDVPISRNYVIEKRRQSFGLNRNDEYKVNVMLGDDDLHISIP